MERWRIEIETSGDAFTENPATEIAAVLRELARAFETFGAPAYETILDVNGNACGSVTLRKGAR